MIHFPSTAAILQPTCSPCIGSTSRDTGKTPEQESHSAVQQSPDGQKLSNEDLKQLQELKSRDREVRAHEAAHMAAAGGLVRGAASFTYQQGPDGQRYAVGGEVSIDTSGVHGDPEATLQKALTIQAAAMAPAQPSSQDLAVAAAAAQMAAQARAELLAQRLEGDNEQNPAIEPNQQSAIEVYKKTTEAAEKSADNSELLNTYA